MRPIGKDGGGRRTGPAEEADAKVRTTLSKEKKAQRGSFTTVPETLAAGPRAGMRPRLTNGGGEGTRASAVTLHALVLETLTVRSGAGVRPRVTNGGGGKAGNRKDGGEGLHGMVALRGEGPRRILHTGSGDSGSWPESWWGQGHQCGR